MNVRVEKNDSKARFECWMDEQVVSYVEYIMIDPYIMDLPHTWTMPKFRGKGLAALPVKEAFEYAKKNDIKIIPTCSYIEFNFLEKYPEWKIYCV